MYLEFLGSALLCGLDHRLELLDALAEVCDPLYHRDPARHRVAAPRLRDHTCTWQNMVSQEVWVGGRHAEISRNITKHKDKIEIVSSSQSKVRFRKRIYR